VHSVADELRALTRSRVLELPIAARIDLALTPGDADLDLFVQTSGLARDEAAHTEHVGGRRQMSLLDAVAAVLRATVHRLR
jgi:hypothetical protein